MLNTIPLPTGPADVPGGTMKPDKIGSHSGVRPNADGDDSFASTLKAVHQTSRKGSEPDTTRGNDESANAEGRSADKAAQPADDDNATCADAGGASAVAVPGSSTEASSAESVDSPNAAPMENGIATESPAAPPIVTDKAAGETSEPPSGPVADRQPPAATGAPRPAAAALPGEAGGAQEGAPPEPPQDAPAVPGVKVADAASTTDAGSRTSTSTVLPGGAPSDATRDPVTDATVEDALSNPSAEPSAKPAGIKGQWPEGGGDSGDNAMSDTALQAKSHRSPKGDPPKGEVFPGQATDTDPQATSKGPAPSADVGLDGQKSLGSPVREALMAAINDDPGHAAAHHAGADAAMPFSTGHAGGRPEAAAPGTPMPPTSMTAAAETFHRDNFQQMVERAVFTVREGQSEARIALKPDQLGHVHLRILTDHSHVSVKILTESPAARDLIDANAHHLKAELQQQGLNVESIDVSVSDDPRDAYREARQRESLMRRMASRVSAAAEDTAGRPAQATGRPYPGRARPSGIDYFA
jgi:flagellar hook-length control protein FliK